ncbi:Hypothetical protein SRAE_X000152900 [Strongyloides ratti]|uniref:ShKT domain-containing protein n=1 Tax=Strongyloides ratti TaxID=34506 RepID=A0A090KQY5_STRRB|nr:Hypothetical protein SRAE_X000152900 [Strongyloides ratti]CEF59784.1 Hypothetical protein SRAE_X000152900 [Strongyloides ratti]
MFLNSSKWYNILIISLKIFFTFSCNSPITNDDCNIGTLDCCNENLINFLNVNNTICNSNSTLHNINCYIQVIEDMYKNGKEKDLLKICNAYTNYKNCLGNSFPKCLSKNYLNNFLNNQKIVFNISNFIRKLTFVCGSGLESFLINDECISNVFEKQKNSLEKCWIDFEESFEQLTVCANLNVYIQCYTNIFFNSCNSESAWWSCEYGKASLFSNYPQCSTQCTFS